MARRKKDAPIELADSHELSFGLVAALVCPPGKMQAFLRDKKTPGLRVRVTAAGAKSYVFEGKLNRRTIRTTIGDVRVWAINAAQQEANRLRVLLDGGIDPRELARDQLTAKAAKEVEAASRALTVADVWPRYMAEGKPKRRDAWKPRYVADLNRAASMGGVAKKRGKGTTKPGHLAALMPMALASIDQDVIRDWYVSEGKSARTQAARVVAMFSGFLGWCATKRDLRGMVNKDAARASELGDVLPPKKTREDALEIAQLPAWFAATDRLPSRTAAAYLKVLALTGARRSELAELTWANVDFQWKKLTIADKVELTRTIPLTPYVAWLIDGLPRVNAFVFFSPKSKSGHIAEPRSPLGTALAGAGIPHVAVHGMRRTFSLLGEAAGAPAGAIAQIMGHKPSAVAEGYRPRSIDALRPYLAQIETFILDKAGVKFDTAVASPGGLHAVA